MQKDKEITINEVEFGSSESLNDRSVPNDEGKKVEKTQIGCK